MNWPLIPVSRPRPQVAQANLYRRRARPQRLQLKLILANSLLIVQRRSARCTCAELRFAPTACAVAVALLGMRSTTAITELVWDYRRPVHNSLLGGIHEVTTDDVFVYQRRGEVMIRTVDRVPDVTFHLGIASYGLLSRIVDSCFCSRG